MITTKMVKRGQNLVTSLLMTISILYFPIKLNAQNDTGRMKSVTILGRFEEQQKALEYMKNADNILNVISSQQIKLFPDVSILPSLRIKLFPLILPIL